MKSDWKTKQTYLEVYRKSHNNAVHLMEEAKLLFKHKHFSRAYFLAYTALEEISKSQHAADVATEFSNEKEFIESFKNHHHKIARVGWAYYEAKSHPFSWIGPDKDDIEEIVTDKPLWDKRQDSLYVGVDGKTIRVPSEQISQSDAKGIIHIVETALHQIWEMEEYWGHQIGTKGFMK